ncbi:MAG: hypothetical protein AAB492_05815 [Patescibacteria group bacterium]
MAEPIPTPEALKPKQIIIGETPVYFTTPQIIDGNTVEQFVINDNDTRANSLTGIGTATILMKESSRKQGERGILIDKPLLYTNKMDPVDWDKVSGIRYTDANNEIHDIPKDQLAFDPPSHEATAGTENQLPVEIPIQEEPVTDILEAANARNVLENLKEDPNTITIVGLKAYETRARDLAARKMQTLVTPAQKDMAEAQNKVFEKSKDAVKKLNTIGRTIWKQSICGTYFAERARQYYLEMLKAAETPFAEEAIKMAETRAKATYDKLLSDKNFLSKAGTKAIEWAKDALGMRTLIEKFALQEMADMKTAGEIKGIESFDRESKAVRLRFSQDMDKADSFIRTNLGEKLDILDPSNETHKPLVDGIKNLMKDYATGEIVDKKAFDEKTKEFFKTTLHDARPDVFAEAELYSSSMFEAAETLRAKYSHEAGLASIDADLNAMKIRLGLAQMGEVTSLIPTQVEGATKKIIDLAEAIKRKSGPLYPAFFNEVTIGTGVALASTALNFVKTTPFRALGLGALAGGTFAGFREYGALQRDYLTHLREREAGDTFSESMKRRNFFEKYLVNQRSAEDMMGKIQTSLYKPDGALKTTLTDDELRMGMATITDITARKAVSESGTKKHIGLIRFSERESIETQRTALDVVTQKGLTDVETYLTTHAQQAQDVLGGNSFEDFMVKLTTNQTTVLKDGAQTLANMTEDPIRNVLGLVAEHAPEITMLKRRFPLGVQVSGMDAIFDQFTRDARVEAVKYGIKAGAVGAGVGAAMQGLGEIFANKVPDVTHAINERISNIDHPATFTPDALTPDHVTDPFTLSPADHSVAIGDKTYQLPSELHIEPVTTGAEGRFIEYKAMIDFPNTYSLAHNQPDIIFGEHLSASQLKDVLHQAGIDMVDGKTAGDVIAPSHSVDIQGLIDPAGKNITMQLPPGYSVEPQGDHYAIMFDKHAIVDNLKFNPDGSLASPLNLPPNLHYDAGITHDVPLQNVADIPKVDTQIETQPSLTIDGDKLGNGGVWDYFLGRASGDNPVSTANAEKNLFRLYEHYIVPQNTDGTPSNITFGENNANPYDHVSRLRDATFGSEKVQEFDISKIANDAHIALPQELFGPDAMHQLADINDLAIKDYQSFIAQGHTSSEALQLLQEKDAVEATVLKLSYFDDSKLPTEAELAPLFKELGYNHVIPTGGPTIIDSGLSSGPEIIPTTKIHEIVITAVHTDTVVNHIGATNPLTIPYMTDADVNQFTDYPDWGERDMANRILTENLASNLPWFPVFLPFRSSLEREYIAPIEPATRPVAQSEFLSPFGSEQMYLTKDQINTRKSPRLTENPEAILNTQEEIAWYNSTLNDTDRQTVLDLNTQHDTPMAAEVARVVAIPTVPTNSGQVYQTLTQYTTQTDAAGALLDPKQTEIVLLGKADEAMKTEVDRFKTDHPEFSVVYLTKEYPEEVTIGQQKRDLTNLIFHRMEERGETSGDVAIIHSFIESGDISPTYLSTVSTSLENPTTDIVHGIYKPPQEAYEKFPMLFAQMRLQELFDGMVRHGQSNSMPNVISGNMAVKASTLAAVGGYNALAAAAEDRELIHLIKTVRNNQDGSIAIHEGLVQTTNPKEALLLSLERLGVATEEDKNISWQELATKVTEHLPKDHLEQSVNQIYQSSYPSLKIQNKDAFDAYFNRSMEALGLTYEIVDGKVKILDESGLTANMAVDLDVESFTKLSSEDVNSRLQAKVAESLSPRETLEHVAGPVEEKPVIEGTKDEEPKISMESIIPTPEIETSPIPEVLPEGISDRINYVIKKHETEGQTTVEMTPNELMDYVKSTIEVPGGRITEGSMSIQDNTVKLSDITIQTPIGKAVVSGNLVDDATQGLRLDQQSLDTKLDFLLRTQGGKIKEAANTLTDNIKAHFNEKITDPNWESGVMHITGDKITLTFVKKTTT